MSKKKGIYIFMCLICFVVAGYSQESGMNEADLSGGGEGFFNVIAKGGVLGVALWLALAGLSVAGVHLIVDSFLKVRSDRFLPETWIHKIRQALEKNDVETANRLCEEKNGPLPTILSTGFGKVESGSGSVQDAVELAAELESEKLMQRVNYLNTVGNLAPMLGLLGTVQGMIMAFATLGTEAGAAKNAMLAVNISQALYTTAAGLVIAVPALGFYSFFRNRAAKIILSMEALTVELMRLVKGEELNV